MNFMYPWPDDCFIVVVVVSLTTIVSCHLGKQWPDDKLRGMKGSICLRPYHVEYTSSRLITEVKQRRAQLVLGWVTAWEYWVL